MKRVLAPVVALIVLVGILSLFREPRLASAQDPPGRPEVKKVGDHYAPLMAKIVYPDGKSKTVMVVATGTNVLRIWHSHQFQARNDENQDVFFWLDTIKSIEPDGSKASVTFKDGSKRKLTWWCGESVMFALEGDTTDSVDMRKVESVEFLRAPRKDSENNAMFDHWKYSPFTGEKLTKVAQDGDAAEK